MAEHDCSRKDDIHYLVEKTDRIHEDVGDIKAILSGQKEILAEHMRRTAANEKQLAILEAQVSPVIFLRKYAIATGKVLIGISFSIGFVTAVIALINMWPK
jgi:hypothetical protein